MLIGFVVCVGEIETENGCVAFGRWGTGETGELKDRTKLGDDGWSGGGLVLGWGGEAGGVGLGVASWSEFVGEELERDKIGTRGRGNIFTFARFPSSEEVGGRLALTSETLYFKLVHVTRGLQYSCFVHVLLSDSSGAMVFLQELKY